MLHNHNNININTGKWDDWKYLVCGGDRKEMRDFEIRSQ